MLGAWTHPTLGGLNRLTEIDDTDPLLVKEPMEIPRDRLVGKEHGPRRQEKTGNG